MSENRRTRDYLINNRPIPPQVGLTALGSFKLGGQRFSMVDIDSASRSIIISLKISSSNPTKTMRNLSDPIGGFTVEDNVDTIGNITNEFDQPAADYVIEQITDSQERSEPEMTVPEDYAEPDRPAGGDTVPT
jgi:hypothetical protein